MRIFLISLLAVGALSGDVEKKSTEHKQVKRGFIPSFGSVNGGQESSQDFVYDQSNTGYQNAAYGSLGSGVSGYTSGLQYTAASLPVHQQSYSGNVYDNHGGQNSVYQVGQGSVLAGGGHQLGHGAYGYSVSSQPIQSRVISRVVNVPVSVPHPVPVTQTVQVSVPRPYPVQVRRPVEVPVPSPVPVYVNKPYAVHIDRPVPVSVPAPYEQHLSVPHQETVQVSHHEPVQFAHQEPVQVGYQQSVQVSNQEPIQVGYQQSVQVSHQEPIQVGYQESVQVSHQEPVHFGSGYEEQNYGQNFGVGDAFYGQNQINEQQVTVSDNTASLGNLGGLEHLNVGTQHYNFGSSELEADLASAHHNTDTVHHHQRTTHKGSSVSKNGNGGYVYNVPEKKFTF